MSWNCSESIPWTIITSSYNWWWSEMEEHHTGFLSRRSRVGVTRIQAVKCGEAMVFVTQGRGTDWPGARCFGWCERLLCDWVLWNIQTVEASSWGGIYYSFLYNTYRFCQESHVTLSLWRQNFYRVMAVRPGFTCTCTTLYGNRFIGENES